MPNYNKKNKSLKEVGKAVIEIQGALVGSSEGGKQMESVVTSREKQRLPEDSKWRGKLS